MQVKQRHHILLSGTLQNATRFKHNIYVPFTPDELIVRHVSYKNDGTEVDLVILWSDYLNNNLCTLSDICFYSPNTTFILNNKSINGEWYFEPKKVDGSATSASVGKYAIMLEFIKY